MDGHMVSAAISIHSCRVLFTEPGRSMCKQPGRQQLAASAITP